MQLYPLFARAVDILNEQKRIAEAALGLKKTARLQGKRQNIALQRMGTLAEQQAAAAAALEAEKQRLLEIQRTAERERAWFMAHPHKFLRPKGPKSETLPTFCLVCKEKAHEYWLQKHGELEEAHQSQLTQYFQNCLEAQEAAIVTQVEQRNQAALEARARAIVEAELVREGLVDEDGDENSQKLGGDALAVLATSALDTNNSVTNELAQWEENIRRVRALLQADGVALVDARGKALLPKKAPKRLRRIAVKSKAEKINSAPNDGGGTHLESTQLDIDGHDIEQVRNLANGLQLRVFHRHPETQAKDRFLGLVEFTAQDLLKPPKGFRTFKLKADPAMQNAAEEDNDDDDDDANGSTNGGKRKKRKKKVSKDGADGGNGGIMGTISLLIRLTSHVSHKTGREQCRWRITLKKVSKLAHVNSNSVAADGSHHLPNPFCEVYWKGECDLGDSQDQAHDLLPLGYLSKYVTVGQTKTKYDTSEADFNVKEYDDDSIFDLPPIWTELAIPGRGPKESDVHVGGGYVARNLLPRVIEAHEQRTAAAEELSLTTPSGKSFRFGAQTSLDDVRKFRAQRVYKSLLGVEIQSALEAARFTLQLAERERQCMAQEEFEQRCVSWTQESKLYAADLIVQEGFALEFQRLLEMVVSPSPLLARLRFLMGEDELGDDYSLSSDFPPLPTADPSAESATHGSKRASSQLSAPQRHDSHQRPGSSRHRTAAVSLNMEDALAQTTALAASTIALPVEALSGTQRPFPSPTRHSAVPLPLSPGIMEMSTVSSMHMPHPHEQQPSAPTTRNRGKAKSGSNNGGRRVLCEDPSTGQLLRVILLPVFNAADEASVLHQAHTLAGLRTSAWVGLRDCAIHDLRLYNAQGFTALHERVCVSLMEVVVGPTVGQQLFLHWDRVSNALFRRWLLQIAEALEVLHEAGLTHRNLHPRAFLLQLDEGAVQQLQKQKKSLQKKPSTVSVLNGDNNTLKTDSQSSSNNGRRGASHLLTTDFRRYVQYLPQCRVRMQDFWFLENAHHASSQQSRGVWGCRMTAPPEALLLLDDLCTNPSSSSGLSNGSQTSSPHYMNRVNDRSDIFAFGVCVFYWATRGQPGLPSEFLREGGDVDACLLRYLPQRWRPWLSIFLRMTLSVNPQRRASAKELVSFLAGQLGE